MRIGHIGPRRHGDAGTSPSPLAQSTESLATWLDHLVQVVALRDPYELEQLSFVGHYLCAFGPRWCSAEAAAQVLFGEAGAGRGSPVSVPGTEVRAR